MSFLLQIVGVLTDNCCEYLHKADHGLHNFSVYNQSQITAWGSQLFGSVVRALDFCSGVLGLNPARGGSFSAIPYFSSLLLSCCKMGAHPG